MANIKMRRMSLVAHQSERNRILRAFIKLGCVETIRSEQLENTEYKINHNLIEEIDSKLIKINFALSFLREQANEAKKFDKKISGVDLKKENKLVELENYEAIAKDEYELFSTISDLEEINNNFIDIKSKTQRLNAQIEQIKAYEPLSIKFSDINGTKNTAMLVGVMPTQRVEQFIEENIDKCFIESYTGQKLNPLVIICHKDDLGEIRNSLAKNDFAICPFDYDLTATQKIEQLQQEIDKLEQKRVSLIKDAMSERQYLNKLKVLYDFYLLERKKIEVMGECSSSKTVFLMEAWVPHHREQEVENTIGKISKYAAVMFRDAYDSEIPPTLTSNNKVVDPFEAITNMFGSPNYRELDPNIFVAIFYFIIFGFMFSDAGYGIILAVSCFAYYFIKKPVKKSGRMMLLFGLGGISTIIWGAIFGGWFGMTFPKEPLINPLDATGSLIMFGLSLAIGALQIAVGFALNGVNQIRQKQVLQGILGQFGWVVIFLGLFGVTGGMLLKVSIMTTISMVIALIGAGMVLVSGAIGTKNPIKMLTGALGRAYDSINIISDLLSYSRLFGLGLTTGVIGFVVNQFATVIVGFFPQNVSFIGWVFALPVLLIGHLFNFAINLLGVYVHNSRLQYVEFFGRFYEGSGHIFMPLGSNTKFTYLDN